MVFRISLFFVSLMMLMMLAGCARFHGDAIERAVIFPEKGSIYVLDSDASLEYSGTMLKAIKHTGGFREVTGTVTLPDGVIEGARIEIVVDMTSVWSNQHDPRGKIKIEDFFEVDLYPEARFISTAVHAVESGYEVQGDLTLHGITNAIRFPVHVELMEEGKQLRTSAEFPVDRRAFEVKYPGVADHLIQNKVIMHFDVNATAAP